MKKFNVKRLCFMAMLSAISVILVFFIHFPIFPSASFLEYDPADIPIFIGTFMFGPVAGLMLTIVVSIIQGIFISPQSGIIGVLMHIFATGSFVLVAGNIYKHKKTIKVAILSLVFGIITMTITMAIWNYFITPVFMGVPRDVVGGMILPLIVPFNLLKASINALLTFILYKFVKRIYNIGDNSIDNEK